METFAANTGALTQVASPVLSLAELSASVQAYGAASPTRKAVMKKMKKQKKKKTKLSVCRTADPHKNSSGLLESFCKRRDGLFQKAHELSSLCNDEVAVIVVSPSGNVSEFASSRSAKLQQLTFKFCLLNPPI